MSSLELDALRDKLEGLSHNEFDLAGDVLSPPLPPPPDIHQPGINTEFVAGSTQSGVPSILDVGSSFDQSQSGPTFGGFSATGSRQTKALGQALRAMQERGHKVEAERARLSSEYEAMKKQKARMKAECDMKLRTGEEQMKRQELSFKAQIEALTREKTQMNINFVKSEEQKKALEREIESIKTIAQKSEQDRRLAQAKVESLESRVKHLEHDLRETHQRARESASLHLRELGDREAKIANLVQRTHQLEGALRTERSKLMDIAGRKEKAEGLLKSVMEINNTLVAKTTKKERPRKTRKSGAPSKRKGYQNLTASAAAKTTHVGLLNR